MSNKTKRKDILFFGSNIITPLILGLVTYALFRPDTYITKYIANIIRVDIDILIVQATINPLLGAFISNFLSDILWAYSLTFTVFIILGISEKNILPTFIICGIFEISIELAQKTGLITGTFDILDIAFELAISAIALVVIKKFIKRGQKNEKKY